MDEKIKTWRQLIQSEKLQDAFEDIQINIRARPDSKLNDKIFKLLLHLYQTADKYRIAKEPNCKTGKEIAQLTKLLCSILIKVPDDNKFIKVLFKVVHCLLSLNLYEDAAQVCCYLQPGNLYHPQDNTMNLLTKILYLWHTSAKDIYLAFTNGPLSLEKYNDLASITKYEMNMIQIAYKNYTKYLINKINIYIDKIVSVDKENKYFDDFYRLILEYLKKSQLHLDKNEKYIIYFEILKIICRVICRTINTTNIECTVKIFDELSGHFNDLLAEDKECHQCFQQFQNFCTTLLVPIENLTTNSAKNIQFAVSCHLSITQRYGYIEGLKYNVLCIAEIVEPMFKYWESRIETDEHMLKQLLDTDILLELMNLFLHIDVDEFYIKQVSIKCRWCQDEICTVKRDLYNAIIMKYKCVNLLCKFHTENMPKQVFVLARKTLKQCVKWIIREMEECKCKRWISLWNICRTLIYNICILSEHIYEESVHLYSFFCVSIFQFQEIVSNSEDLENISCALYKLSVLHYKNGMYAEAMTTSAVNALLTYNQSNTKAFLIWTSIKKHVCEEIAQLTISDCLKNDKDKIKREIGLSINITNRDLINLCSCEAKCLLEECISFTKGVSAILDKLRKLKQSHSQYAHVVQLLGHYLLSFEHDSSILKYHEQIISDLKQDESNSVALLCLEANLNFFKFVEELHEMNKQTQMEMENTKFALYAPKLPELEATKSPNIIPAYTMINVKKASNLLLSLQKYLEKLKQLFKCNIKEIVENWEPSLVLRILITAGEYCRLYRYEDCEAEAWTLAYKLASKIDDYRTIIYVTGRCISLRQIDYKWIDIANEYAVKYRNSTDKNVIGAIAMFWISLADLNFECGKYNEAKQLLNEATSLSGISFFDNQSVYLLSLDVIIRNSSLYKDNIQHEDYGLYIVEGLITSRCLNKDLLTEKWENQADYLFSYDILFTTSVNLSVRISSLLSFRGISPDLVLRLKSAQSLGAVLRVAELLKSLCYIDLSHSQLNDCEVKLQGLEHMLGIETFQSSMNVEPVIQTSTCLFVTPTKIVNDPIRDAPQRCASPILGKTVFDLPKFTLHTNCDCYMCSNVSYQYLVFTTTCIRAQLYALQNQVAMAFDHFYGAFKIKQRLFKEEESVLPENWPDDESGVKRFSWQARFYIIDYINLLIDFCYFLKANITSKQQNVFDIAKLAIDICHRYKLEGHSIYMSARELALDNDFQSILESSDCLKFTVLQSYDIDITSYERTPTNSNVCVTPSVQNHSRKPLSIRRKRSPVALKISKINIIWSDDEDDNNLSPPLTTRPTKICKYPGAKSVTRKILQDLSDDINSNTKDSILKKTKSKDDLNGDGDNIWGKSIKDIMIKVAPLVPDISDTLLNLTDKPDVPATIQNINELIQKVKNLKINSSATSRNKSLKDKTKLKVVDYNKNLNRAIELLKTVEINEKIDENVHSFMAIKTDEHIEDQGTLNHGKKFFKTGGLAKKHLENPKLLVNNEKHNIRMTRSSLRKAKEEL